MYLADKGSAGISTVFHLGSQWCDCIGSLGWYISSFMSESLTYYTSLPMYPWQPTHAITANTTHVEGRLVDVVNYAYSQILI